MHYNETNQIQMEGAMPTNPYVVNPIMTTQEYTKGGTNELSKCVDAFVNIGAPENETLSMCKEDSSTIIGMLENSELDEFNLTDTFMQENIIIFNSTIPYFEFTVDGKNTTTNKDIWYEVVLSKGDNIDGKTRIKDNLLRFRLTETKDNKETIVVDNKSYSDLTSKRIWVDTINKNTINEVVHTYRLYIWISNDTVIGNVNQDYTMEEWKNIFASIKVGVSGDFNEKYIILETSCFTTDENETGLTITDYDETCGKKIIIPQTINNKNVTKIGEGAFRHKNLMNLVIPDSVTTIESNSFANNQLTNIEIPSSVTTIGAYSFTNNNIQDLIVPDTVTKLHCKSFDDGVVNNRDMTCQETNASCFTTYTNNDDTISITDYDNTCDKDVIIPKTINNKNVTTIDSGAFVSNQLTSVIIPDTITDINKYAFQNNKLAIIKFPTPSLLKSIAYYSFAENNIISVIIPDSVTFLHCSAFDYQVIITKPDNLVCKAPLE